jgi:uncharacterized membrane protein YdbT with pleckstrin-like domain
MGYIDDSLSDGEDVRERFNLHWIARIPMIVWIVLAIPTFGVTLFLALWEWLKLRSTELGVTNRRLVIKKGIISRNTEEMKLSSVETVEIIQGVPGRILGYGNVKITGRGISDLLFRNVDDPMEMKRRIESVNFT